MKSNMKLLIYKFIILGMLILPFASQAEEDFCSDFPKLSQSIIGSIEGKISHVNQTKERSGEFFLNRKTEISEMKYSDEMVKKVISQNVAAPRNFREKISKFTFEKHLNNIAHERHTDVLAAHTEYLEELESLIDERTKIIESGLSSALDTVEEATEQSVDLCNKGEADLAKQNFSTAITEVKQTLSDTVLSIQDIKSKIIEAKSVRDSKIKSAFEKFNSAN